MTRHRSRSYPRRLELLLDEELLLDDEEEELELPVDEELLDDDSLDELLLDELVRMPVGSVGDPPHAVKPPTGDRPGQQQQELATCLFGIRLAGRIRWRYEFVSKV